MPFEVRLSQIKDMDAFKKAITDHVTNLTAFSKSVGKPRPTTHPLVEACLKRVQARGKPDQYVEDWSIINDLPAPDLAPVPVPPTLEEKKQKLVNALYAAENAVKVKYLPLRKQRYLQTKYLIAFNIKEDERTPEQSEDLVAYNDFVSIYRKFELIGSKAESDIEDLTEDNIDSWQLPTFE